MSAIETNPFPVPCDGVSGARTASVGRPVPSEAMRSLGVAVLVLGALFVSACDKAPRDASSDMQDVVSETCRAVDENKDPSLHAKLVEDCFTATQLLTELRAALKD